MASKIRIELNSAGITQLLSSDDVRYNLLQRAQAMADAAGGEPDFEASSWVGRDRTGGRAMAMVKTGSAEGRRLAAEEQALERAIDAGR